MNALEVRALTCGYQGHAVVENVSFSLEPGRAIVLLGPNGVGKTTLFKTMLGFLPRLAGEVLVEGEDVRDWTRKRYAQSVAYVPQSHDAAFGFTVREMVLMGRTPTLGGFTAPSRDEPCANLDLGNQVVVLRRVRELVDKGLAVVITSHDPNHAFLLDDDVACMHRRGGVRSGAARAVLTPEVLAALYGVDVGVGLIEGSRGQSGWACVPFLDGERMA